MKKNFSDVLKELRIKAGYSQKDVYEMLGIRQSTFSAWETGRAEPSADILLKLCKLYKVNDIFSTFGYDGYNEDGSLLLNINEIEMMEKYRSLDDSGKEFVDSVLRHESDRSAAASEQADRISALERQPASIIEFQPKSMLTGRMIEYFHSASAGSGVFILGNEITDQIAIPDTPENRKIDYAIKVSGNSMEPDYKDGEIALISQKMKLRHGDIGIFIVNNAAYIKEYGKTELISRNPSADNIRISEYDNIVCMGKVVGKLEEQ